MCGQCCLGDTMQSCRHTPNNATTRFCKRSNATSWCWVGVEEEASALRRPFEAVPVALQESFWCSSGAFLELLSVLLGAFFLAQSCGTAPAPQNDNGRGREDDSQRVDRVIDRCLATIFPQLAMSLDAHTITSMPRNILKIENHWLQMTPFRPYTSRRLGQSNPSICNVSKGPLTFPHAIGWGELRRYRSPALHGNCSANRWTHCGVLWPARVAATVRMDVPIDCDLYSSRLH